MSTQTTPGTLTARNSAPNETRVLTKHKRIAYGVELKAKSDARWARRLVGLNTTERALRLDRAHRKDV